MARSSEPFAENPEIPRHQVVRHRLGRTRRVVWGLAVAIACLAFTAPGGVSSGESRAVEPAAPPVDFESIAREIVDQVETRLFDTERAARWAEVHRDYAAGITEPEAFRRATAEALARLGISHTSYHTPTDPSYFGLLAIFESFLKVDPHIEDLGVGLVRRGDGWYVGRVFPGGPAEAAGLRRGDLLVEADGRPFAPIESLRGRDGQTVRLGVRREAGGALLDLPVQPRLVHPKQEWLRAQKEGSRLIDWPSGGAPETTSIAYVPLWSCAGAEHLALLKERLVSDLASAAALVLDFRDGWGGCSADVVGVFDDALPRFESIGRDGEIQVYDPAWRKPTFVLINRGSRSGKEMVARALQRNGLATLVGERTAGAVVAGTPILLADRSLLYLAVRDARIDGERLEGVGVHPDLPVADDLPFAAGQDAQLAAALDAAATAARDRG